MVYCTVEEVRGVLARDVLEAIGTAATLLDADILDYQITSAAAEVDGRLGGRYKVPFPDPAPALVKSLTVDVAAYLATLTYRQSVDLEPTDPVALRYARAQALFKGIADGSVDLPGAVVPGDGGAQPTGIATVRNPYVGQLFGATDFDLAYRNGGRVIGRGR